MGMARKAGARHSRWSNFITNRNRVAKVKGATVPGTGGHHSRRKGKSGSNKSGSLNKLNGEWSASGRKQEDDQRGINNRARQQAIEDQVESWVEYVTIDGKPVAVIDSLSEKWSAESDRILDEELPYGDGCPTDRYPRGSIRSDGTHRDLPGKTGNRNNDLPGSPGPYWWS